MYLRDKLVWRLHRRLGAVEVGWYSHYEEDDFLTAKTFGTKGEAELWRDEFWEAYWRLMGANVPRML